MVNEVQGFLCVMLLAGVILLYRIVSHLEEIVIRMDLNKRLDAIEKDRADNDWTRDGEEWKRGAEEAYSRASSYGTIPFPAGIGHRRWSGRSRGCRKWQRKGWS